MSLVKVLTAALLSSLASAGVAGEPIRVRLASNPLHGSDLQLDGEALARLRWNDDAPAFPGDAPGSLTARYDSNMPPGRVGWPLPGSWSEEDPFTATAVFVIEPEGFAADPFGFFQISWGLWNSRSTGMERTGTFSDFAGDTFELIEFAYFPNLSPFFGGPFLSPTVFGVADRDNPLFDPFGSFANLAFGSIQLELPLGQPLLTTIEHRPADRAVVVSVKRITEQGRLLPLPGGVVVVDLAQLDVERFSVDTVGLTLWRDGFAGTTPSLTAELTLHAILAQPGLAAGVGVVP